MATGTIVDVVMPQMGVSVSEGTISTWMKGVGDTIEKDETLLEISTDKVDTEVPSPVTGIVTSLLVEEGETVDVGVKLAEIEVGGEGGGAAPAAAPAAPELRDEVPAAPAATELTQATPSPVAPAAPATAPATQTPTSGGAVPGRFVSPVVASIAAEQGIDPSVVPGTGSGGRVTKKDILAFIEGGAVAGAPAPAGSPAAAAVPSAAPVTQTTPPAPSAPKPVAAASASTAAPSPATFQGGEQIVPFNPMRKAIARHMVESVHTSPHVTSTMEVDMTRVVNLRTRVKSELEAQWGVKVTFTHFVIRALIDAIAHYPLINSEIRGDSAVVKSYVNLGIAVALDGGEGLIVPVLRNAEEKNLIGIARGVNDIAQRARTKKLRPDDVSGGTFTLTNPGIFGAIHGTPI
ncbi:MAG: sucB, partial [Thermoleophilia bacterium]|nr:sucB [Thermoleophilia bacterium]